MPLSATVARYRPARGRTPNVSPGVLRPLNDLTNPSLDPSSLDNQTPNPVGSAPVQIPRSSSLSSSVRTGPIDPSAHGGRKMPSMPPPGMKHYAAGDVITEPTVGVVGEDQPEVVAPLSGNADAPGQSPVNEGPLPLPALDEKKREEREEPKRTPGVSKGPKYLINPEDTGVAGGPASPPAPAPTPSPDPATGVPADVPMSPAPQLGSDAVSLPAPQTNSDAYRKQLADIDAKQGPIREKLAPAPNNWAQRLALAALSLTRFAPVADQLVHPKWAQNQAVASQQLANLEGQRRDVTSNLSADALAEQREAQAEFRKAQAAQQQSIEEDRHQRASTAVAAQHEKEYNDFQQMMIHLHAIPAVNGEKAPEGYAMIQDPRNPGLAWHSPNAFVPLPQQMGHYFPGRQVNEPIPTQDLAKAYEQKWKEDLEQIKADNKPEKQNEAQWIVDADNPDPKISGPAQAHLKRSATQHAIEHPPSINNISYPGVNIGGTTTLTGEDYLNTLPTGLANQARAVIAGKDKIPSAMSRSGMAAQVRDAVYKAEPKFSEGRWEIRHAFNVGPEAVNLGNLNTAPVHLDHMADAAVALHNHIFTPGNEAYNYLATLFGNSAPTNFETLKTAVSGEMARALKGTATDKEIESIQREINSKQSPEQLKDSIDYNLRILGDKLRTAHERYKQQLPDDNDWSPVLPTARAVYAKHGIDPTAPPRVVSEKALRQHAIEQHFDPDQTVEDARHRPGVVLVP